MSKKNVIIKGTLILTLAGFLSRFMGFFYRIFLSQTFGAEGVGLYQLIFPVYALIYSLTTAGIQTAISQQIGKLSAQGKRSQMRYTLYAGLIVSFSLSALCMLFVQKNALFIASEILGDSRCRDMLIAISYVFPFSAIHSCICGYYYGMKKTALPAFSQLLEQVVRIVTVYILFLFFSSRQQEPNISIAVCGLVIGEIASSLCSIFFFLSNHKTVHKNRLSIPVIRSVMPNFKRILLFSTPLTLNRALINLLQSIEAVSIPEQLKAASFGTSQALSIYGVLTGMALPCIMFPSAITSAIAVLLVPTVAEIQTLQDTDSLQSLVKKISSCCLLLGIFSWLFFLLFGNQIGILLFHNKLAGQFLLTLSWICPFLYLNSALLSILNGLGKTFYTFIFHMISLFVRITGVFAGIPLFGIQGYLWGLLVSQLSLTFFCIVYLKNYLKKKAIR